MKSINKRGMSEGWLAMVAVALLGFGVQWVQAQAIEFDQVFRINTRPLTPQEIIDYGLTNTTQTASGNRVVGLGRPVYLEALVTPDTVVTQVVWSLDSVVDDDEDAIASFAVITDSPLGLEIPTFDFGYSTNSRSRNVFDLVDRAMIVPDVEGTYHISAQLFCTNLTYTDTNDVDHVTNGVLMAQINVIGSVYMGSGEKLYNGENNLCLGCHYDKWDADAYYTTLHSVALKDNITDPDGHFRATCIQCHTLGYDTAVGATNGGFDDVAADLGWTIPSAPFSITNWTDMPQDLKNKANVQCESCHGPAYEHMKVYGGTDEDHKIAVNFSAGTCGQCHDKPGHHVKVFQWKQAQHAVGYVFRESGSCSRCHSTVGFIDYNDPSEGLYGVVSNLDREGVGNEGITCAACHDPHAKGEQIHQLRDIQSVTLANGDVITDGGAGLVCLACHQDRYDPYDASKGGLDSGSSRGPHHGTQGDMLFGRNAVTYGKDLPSSKHAVVVEESCVQCHMQELPEELEDTYVENHVGGHTFALFYDDGTNAPVHLTGTCKSCHGEIEDFDFGGEDYDLDGMVEGVQTEIDDMMDELALLLGTDDPSLRDFVDEKERMAVWNYIYVKEDGSHGVHNPKYAAAILRASISDLKGGIDIDCDGLLDDWEMDNFGDLTSQTGSGDADGDGLTNEQEQNLGTDPMLVDSDDDGVSDLLEIQGGSDPWDPASVPTGDMVILSAVEVGYLPQATGTTVRIQSLDSLSGMDWLDIAPARTNDGGWVFEFDSTRGTSNRFYRAVEE